MIIKGMRETWMSFDLTVKKSTAALFTIEDKNSILIAESVITDYGDHSENLILGLDALLTKNKLELKNISRFITLEGPGSYTGMRIGFATLKGFYFALRRPVTLLKNAEIRFLKSGEKSRDVWVVQHLNAKKYLVENLKTLERKTVEEPELTSINPKISTEISAVDLGQYYFQTEYKKHFETEADIIAMSPLYL